MRIALIVERFEPEAGGLEHAAWQTAHALAGAGDTVTVVARRAAASEQVEVVALPVATAWQPWRVLRFAARAARWVMAARGAGRIDLAHAWSRVPGCDLFHGGEGSHLHYMRRTYGPHAARWRRASPRHAAQLHLERRILGARAVHLQPVAASGARELAGRFALPPERVHTIGYGVDTRRFRPDGPDGPDRPDGPDDPTARATARREIDPDAGSAPCLLLAGSGWRRKGLDTALRALAAARTEGVRLWVAGRDDPRPWRRSAARLGISGRVRFLGVRDDVERVHRAADALLLPTRYDAFGLVALEAAASARPCILSATAGAADLLAEAAVVVADPEDVAGFARAIDTLAEPAVRCRLGARGRAIALEHDWERQTARLRALYARLCEERA